MNRGLKRVRRSPRLGTDQIPGLIRRDGKQPGSKPPLRIKLACTLVNLKERLLEDVFGRRAVSQESNQEVE